MCALNSLGKLADSAHKAGRFEEEIALRQRFSREAWATYDSDPKSLGRYNRWAIVFFNDLPLALLLEGTNKLSDAEVLYRHNQRELAHERLAGNDIKSQNELHLAHLLYRQGKDSEAISICSHWKSRVKHNADFALYAVKHNTPTPPLYLTPEVEIAKWDLACGKEEEGLKLLTQQIVEHPDMLAPFSVLSEYYFSLGEFPRAQKVESDGSTAVTGH